MTQDLLEKLSSALAAQHDGAHVAPELTRTRIMQRVAEQRRKRRLRLVLVAPLFGLGVGTTALAASDGAFQAAIAWLPTAFRSTESSAPPRARTSEDERPREAARGTLKDEVPENARAEANEVPPAKAERQVEATLALRGSAPQAMRQPADPAPELESPEDPDQSSSVSEAAPEVPPPPPIPSDLGLSIYRQAHDAQFKNEDYGRALVGYRSYLREHPDGALVLEASYNAALCEVRLGRLDAARRSLTPFARGTYGSYRQSEARALLEALAPPPSPTE